MIVPDEGLFLNVIDTKLYIYVLAMNSQNGLLVNKGNNKITELRAILQRESQNS